MLMEYCNAGFSHRQPITVWCLPGPSLNALLKAFLSSWTMSSSVRPALQLEVYRWILTLG